MATRSALRQYQLSGVQDTGRTVGNGSYATVKELEFCGLKCVGKKIHHTLIDSASPREKAAMLGRFAEECQLLNRLHHPCVVQTLGVYFDHGSEIPVLVMEYLHSTLSACLERYGILPEVISYGILHDVGLGLHYLHQHSPPIVHRDLSANNVLLTSSMSAKISDLGVAKVLNLTPAQMTQKTSTQAPGTPCYMPPEALAARPTYTAKIDSYSFGVLVIHTLSGRWPFPTDLFRPDPKNPDVMVPCLELERRAEYLQDIGQTHPLMGLIRQTLSNAPNHRPNTAEILRQITSIVSRIPETRQNKMEMIQQVQERLQSQQTEIETKQLHIESLAVQNQDKHSEIEFLRTEVERLSVLSPQRDPEPRQHAKFQFPSEFQSQPILLHPQAKLYWRRVADLPVGMFRPQAVVVGERVYVGGGLTESDSENLYLIFRYSPVRDEWTTLPPCPVVYFGLGQFAGEFLTVGGVASDGNASATVYHFREGWEEFLQPMPTARYFPSIISVPSVIIACGGATGIRDESAMPCTTVEIYKSETSQWYTTSPLPMPCWVMSSAIVANTCYFLGGVDTFNDPVKVVLHAPVTTLIQNAAVQPSNSTPCLQSTIWKRLQNAPLMASTAASLGEMLLAVGGMDDSGDASARVYVHPPSARAWIRVESGDIPKLRLGCTAVKLSANTLIVIGGWNDDNKYTATVFLGSVTI